MVSSSLSILIIDGNRNDTIKVLSCLTAIPKIKVHAIATEPKTPVQWSRLCKTFHLKETKSDEERIEFIRKVARKVRPDLLFPLSRLGILFAIKNYNVLKQIAPLAPIPTLESFEKAQDKGKFSDFLEENNIPKPFTIHLNNDQSLTHQLSRMTFPALIKPKIGTNGLGIRQFEDLNSLEKFLRSNKDLSPSILQSKRRGTILCSSTLSIDGKILAHNLHKEIFPNPVPFRPHLGMEFIQNENLWKITEKVIKELKWTGIANFDMILDEEDNQIKVIELNPRYWGSLRGSLTMGLNFPYLACLLALNQPLPATNLNHTLRYIDLENFLKTLLPSYRKRGFPRVVSTKVGWEYILKDPLPFLNNFWNKLKSMV